LTIASAEVFTLVYEFAPRRGPSDSWGSSHAYCLVKLTDSDGLAGWGETYLRTGMASILEELAGQLIGRDARAAHELWLDVWASGEQPFATSALSIALDDLRAREAGVSVATLYGGRRRDRVRAYAAHQGYVEGVDPEASWRADAEDAIAAGLSAFKFRIGRYSIPREVALLTELRRELPADLTFLTDASGAYTPRSAIRMGRALEDLDVRWFEGPLYEWEGYLGWERLPPALDIAIAGAEVTFSRAAIAEQLARGCFDIVQPDAVICGGIGEALFYADLARLHAVQAVPHTSGGAIGIAAGLQLIGLLPDPTRLPQTDAPILEVGLGENPWRTDVLADGWRVGGDGWVDIPTGPGLGVEVDEKFVRSHAREIRRVRREGQEGAGHG
jgi:D-galactarolactone cycloisomerase